jgi:hypothetical protein
MDDQQQHHGKQHGTQLKMHLLQIALQNRQNLLAATTTATNHGH